MTRLPDAKPADADAAAIAVSPADRLSPADRERIATEYYNYASRCADSWCGGRRWLSEDFRGWALLALAAAIDSYRLSLRWSFRVHLDTRLMGAKRDALQSLNPMGYRTRGRGVLAPPTERIGPGFEFIHDRRVYQRQPDHWTRYGKGGGATPRQAAGG